MSVNFRSAAALAAALGILLCGAAAAAEKKPAPGSCSGCHAALGDVLPETHAAVPGATLAACLRCHHQAQEAKPDLFASQLHRSHSSALGCEHCHPKGSSLRLAGTKRTLGRRSKDDAALEQEQTANWASGRFTAAAHQRKDIFCGGCHGAELPVLGATVEKERCLACHPLEPLQAKSGAGLEFKDRNPHKSHLGEMECTTCHHAHAPSTVYCLSCHPKFEMKVPGAEAVAPAASADAVLADTPDAGTAVTPDAGPAVNVDAGPAVAPEAGAAPDAGAAP